MQYNKVWAACCLGALLACGACERMTKDEKFKLDFEQYTQKECPKFVDEYTRLDSACYDIGSRTLSYHYTVQGNFDNEEFFTDELTEPFHDEVLKGLKTSLQLKPYKDEGITFHYDYRSMTSGKLLLELTFTADDYGK